MSSSGCDNVLRLSCLLVGEGHGECHADNNENLNKYMPTDFAIVMYIFRAMESINDTMTKEYTPHL